VVRWAGTTVASRTVDLAETSNTDSFAEIDVAGDGGSTNVEPVNVLWWKLLCWAGLYGINPTLSNKLVLARMSNGENMHKPGIGSFPCLFKKAEYASMNFCA